MWTILLLHIGIFIDVYLCMPVSIRICTDLKPLYLLNHVIPNRYSLPRGVSIVYDEEHNLHAYKLSEHAGNLNFPASDIFSICSYWPEEYSVLATFKLSPNSDTPTWENGYLFSLIPQSSVHLKLGISLSREQITIIYSDYKIQPGKKSISFDRKLYDDEWHTIIVTVAGNTVGLRVDCGKTENRAFERTFPAYLDTSGHHIHVGNRKIQPGQFRGLLKQLFVLPGADASQMACPAEKPSLPSISMQPDVQMMEADDPQVPYTTAYDAECNWKETGKLWYDIYSQELKVCQTGTWQLAMMPQQDKSHPGQSIPKLDYFTEHEKIVAPAPAIDIHIFTITEEGQFVVMANYNDKGARKQKSMIYKWVNETLHPYQNLTVYEPSSFTSFSAGRHFYLAVANMRRSSARSPSEYVTVYKWHNRKKKFKPHQELPGAQPRDVEHFEIDGDHYLAVANHRAANKNEGADIDYNSRSFIWKFDRKNKTFAEFQKISTTGAWDWTYFSARSQSGELFHFLVVANTIDNNRNVKLESKIYYWNKQGEGKIGNFNEYYLPFQTSGATDFEYFEMNGELYLAVANGVSTLKSNDTIARHSTISTIYKGNIDRREFEPFQEIPTFGIIDWEYFTVGTDSYLIASNQLPGHSQQLKLNPAQRDTIIYRWKGAEKFVPEHRIQTPPTADWEVLKDGDNTYLIYANGAGRSTAIYKAKLR